MKVRGQLKFIAIDRMAPSLHSLIADGQYRATSLFIVRWKTLIKDSKLPRHCYKEGFNVVGDGNEPAQRSAARIGMISNEFRNCSNPDAVIGFGTTHLAQDYTCGTVARWGGVQADIAAMGYIFAGRKTFSCFLRG